MVAIILIPAAPGAIWQQTAIGFNFMNLTAAHPKDITCLEIDWAEQHWNCIYSRHAYDLDGPHSASVNEHRKAVHQSYFLINYQETSRLSAGDVAEDTAIHYI